MRAKKEAKPWNIRSGECFSRDVVAFSSRYVDGSDSLFARHAMSSFCLAQDLITNWFIICFLFIFIFIT